MPSSKSSPRRRLGWALASVVLAAAAFAWWHFALTQPQTLELASVAGEVRINGEVVAVPGWKGAAPGTVIVTGAGGHAGLRLTDGSLTQVAPESRVDFAEALESRSGKRYKTAIRLDAGEILREVPLPQEGVSRTSDVLTRATNVGVRGTLYVVRSEGDVGRIMVHRGAVALGRAKEEPTALGENYGTVARAGQKPEPPSVLLPPPALIGPPPSERFVVPTIGFAWAAVEGARAYLLEVARDERFRDLVAQQRTADTGTRLAAPLPHDARYFWRVSSIDARELRGRGTEPRQLHYKHFHEAGLAAVKAGDARAALALYSKAEPGYADDARLLKDVGWAHYLVGELPQARAYLDRSLERDDTDLEARIRRGRMLYWLKDHAAAAADYDQVLAKTPEDIDALWGLAEVDIAEGRHREAIARLQRVLAKAPNHEYALFSAARAWLALDDKARAREFLARELTLRPNNAAAAELYATLQRKPLPPDTP